MCFLFGVVEYKGSSDFLFKGLVVLLVGIFLYWFFVFEIEKFNSVYLKKLYFKIKVKKLYLMFFYNLKF